MSRPCFCCGRDCTGEVSTLRPVRFDWCGDPRCQDDIEGTIRVRGPEMRRETQQSVAIWAYETFGSVKSNASIAARANVEMAELLQCLAADDAHGKAGEECADVVICLMRLAQSLGVDLPSEVDRKMRINRAREWTLDGNGHGQHVKGRGK